MRLESAEVHLWSQSLTLDDDRIEHYSSLLTADERDRAARFHFDVHRNRFKIARGRLREIVSGYLATPPREIVFSYGARGKPYVAGDTTGLQFNLSHSSSMAIYAFTRQREIGVDVEEVREEFAHEQIPERFFSPGEVQALRALPPEAQARGFFECWTRKEAYVKARAEGLTIPLNSFEVSLGIPACLVRNGEGWTLRSFDIPPNYVGAIVRAGEERPVTRVFPSPPSDYAIILR